LQWLCVTLGDLLELENKLVEHWDDTLGGINPNVTKYLERYLFKDFSQPLVLVLEKVDLVFEQATFNVDFCRLLRGWNDAAKRKRSPRCNLAKNQVNCRSRYRSLQFS